MTKILRGIVSCTFTSVWDDGSNITTPCQYEVESGEVTPQSLGQDPRAAPKGSLVKEFITLNTGEELEVCKWCHEYTLKTEMNEGIGKQLYENKTCRNPSCPSREVVL